MTSASKYGRCAYCDHPLGADAVDDLTARKGGRPPRFCTDTGGKCKSRWHNHQAVLKERAELRSLLRRLVTSRQQRERVDEDAEALAADLDEWADREGLPDEEIRHPILRAVRDKRNGTSEPTEAES